MAAPNTVTIRTYQVGFGDCFLLSFGYASGERHVLIDFGTMALPSEIADANAYQLSVAQQIAKDCGGSLAAVVATHRHRDHISGFARRKGKGSGEIIRKLKPKVVIQPWTEDFNAAIDAQEPTEVEQKRAVQQSLRDAAAVAERIHIEGSRQSFGPSGAQAAAIGIDNVANRDAIENLESMASDANYYVYHGSRSGLEGLLPGVKVTVLGPPTLKQSDRIRKQTASNKDEFWMLRAAYWQRAARAAKALGIAGEPRLKHRRAALAPPRVRWPIHALCQDRGESLLSMVRTLDTAMNNTSVILLFEVGSKALLFPGDAQWENWEYALSKPEIVKRLANVDVYKVGHHGSRNATPKTLWDGFKQVKAGGKGLTTFLSTLEDVHGHVKAHTEVPRLTLLKELRGKSKLTDTQDYDKGELRSEVKIAL